ncbi:EndoU domain-containing protein [Actinoplanes sp. Pm04-4]|uniref:EndoU domain-containing protein n=1 Tax=Paractinoplanes pyxinae TaxID=2997416 RepID=A0ABT4AUU1_9ACTN|nr:EndoU domain-containing protein [Actinoplanes pyxinae]MCY1138008.1 EndoU domain-containing protein [Actinoplanes pyxinae]
MAKGSGRLMRAALRFLRRTKKRARPDRMNPHFTTHTIGGGDLKPGKTKGTGYHYRPGGQDFPGRRLMPGTKVTYGNGVYEAKVEFFDPTLNPPAGAWKGKAGNKGFSTFFPDDWTPAQVDNAVSGAFKNSTPFPGGMWAGTYNGVTIRGYYDEAGGFTHGWPVP